MDLHAEPAVFEMAVRALAEGNPIWATGRIFQVNKDTVRQWRDRAAPHCCLVMLYLWRDLRVLECQMDELWSFVHLDGLPAWCVYILFSKKPIKAVKGHYPK